jgi:hypothetical protein
MLSTDRDLNVAFHLLTALESLQAVYHAKDKSMGVKVRRRFESYPNSVPREKSGTDWPCMVYRTPLDTKDELGGDDSEMDQWTNRYFITFLGSSHPVPEAPEQNNRTQLLLYWAP